MRLILVRHGETPWNREGRFQGRSLIGLSQRGVTQARHIVKAILPMKPSALYASPLPRSIMTAEEISRELSTPIVPIEALQEVNLGELEGITGQEMRTQYSQVYSAWRQDPAEVVFPGGESIGQLQERAWQAILDLEKAHPKDVIVTVSHNFAIRAILCRFLGLPLKRLHSLRIDLASISILQLNYRSRQVITMNDRCHLLNVALPDP